MLTTILEAQACGLPVLSTTHADNPNIVMPGESAQVATEWNVDVLMEYLLTLIVEPDRWIAMGAKCRDFVESYHDVTNEVK